MGLTPFDVSNLEHSMSSLGDAFVQRRHDEEQRKRDGIEADMRQRMLQAEMRRMDSEENRSKLLGEGTVAATLQDDDGNQVTYRGPQSGYDGFMQSQSSKGRNWSPVSVPKKTPYSIKLTLPDGEMEMHANTPEELLTQAKKIRDAGGTKPKPDPQVGQNAVAQALQQADQWEAKANEAEQEDPNDTRIEGWRENSNLLRAWAKSQANPQAKPVKTGEMAIDPNRPEMGKTFIYGQPGDTPSVPKKSLDAKTAAAYLKKAGGDKNKARQMATADGYNIPAAPTAAPVK